MFVVAGALAICAVAMVVAGALHTHGFTLSKVSAGVAVAGVFVVLILYLGMNERRLIQRGEIAEALVTGSSTHGKNHIRHAELKFEHDGTTWETHAVDPLAEQFLLRSLGKDSRVWVCFEAKEPKAAVIYEIIFEAK